MYFKLIREMYNLRHPNNDISYYESPRSIHQPENVKHINPYGRSKRKAHLKEISSLRSYKKHRSMNNEELLEENNQVIQTFLCFAALISVFKKFNLDFCFF